MATLTLQRRSQNSIMVVKRSLMLKTKSSAIHWMESWRNWRLLTQATVPKKQMQWRKITIYKSLITQRSLKLFMVLKTLQMKPERCMRVEWEISLLVMTSGQTLKSEDLRPSQLHTDHSMVNFLALAKSMSPLNFHEDDLKDIWRLLFNEVRPSSFIERSQIYSAKILI